MSMDEKEKEKEISGSLEAEENKEGPFVFILGFFFLSEFVKGDAQLLGGSSSGFWKGLEIKNGKQW